MLELVLLVVCLILLLAAFGLLLVLVQRRTAVDLAPLLAAQDRLERTLREELAQTRREGAEQARQAREETAGTLQGFNQSVLSGMAEMGKLHKAQMDTFSEQLGKLTQTHESRAAELKMVVEARLVQIQQDNALRLEEMRKTVDEKLQGTLEKRLGESFKLVSERLEQVAKGLGEMQSLAGGVGDLKKVLSNVKTRGIWGEMQLGNLLAQMLTPEQYAINVATKAGSADRVEFAVKLPGRTETDAPVWLPIDAKFPKEDYERLMEAADKGDAAGVEEAARQLETRLKLEGRAIQEKYLDPPNTTDFGILFLPVEGLYAEVLRRPGLVEALQRESRVNVAGPTTLAALLNSLQMGFRTLAIQKRSSEVWTVLGAVKAEFGKFGEVLDRVHKKLQEAGNVIDQASVRSRAIGRRLKGVEELAGGEVERVLGLEAGPAAEPEAESEEDGKG
ncbi:MAG: DNA recombination protein RmuC [Lentisphaeria bacterium]